jgi:hypothetical protein
MVMFLRRIGARAMVVSRTRRTGPSRFRAHTFRPIATGGLRAAPRCYANTNLSKWSTAARRAHTERRHQHLRVAVVDWIDNLPAIARERWAMPPMPVSADG